MEDLTPREEIYLQKIDKLIVENGFAKVNNIAKELDISPPSVSEMLQKISDKGYIIYKKHYPVTLTKLGEKKASELSSSLTNLTKFFVLLGINEEIASIDACNIEHIINEETIETLTKFLEFMEHSESAKWLENFHKFRK